MAEELVSPNLWSSEGVVTDPAKLATLQGQFMDQQQQQTNLMTAQAQLLGYRASDPQLSTGFTGLQDERIASQDRSRDRYDAAMGSYNTLGSQSAGMLSGIPGEYRNIADQYGAREADLTGYLDNLGQSQIDTLNQQRAQSTAQTKQSLVQRGLTGATTYDAALRGVNSQADQSMTQLQDQLTRQKMDYRSKLSADHLQAQGMAPQVTMDVAKQQYAMQAQPLQQAIAYKEQAPNLQAIGSYASALTSI